MFNNNKKVQKEKSSLGVLAGEEDKNLIKKVAECQRRSVASFVLESALIMAKDYLKKLEEKNG